MEYSFIYTPIFTVSVFFGYILGSIPFGWLLGKLRGINILEKGSGNIGATNVWRILGWRLGTLVFALDVLKGFLPTYVVFHYFESHLAASIIGLMCILGHSFSPFLGFKGGKGISTGLGVFLGICTIPALGAFATFGIVLGIFRYVSLASMLASISLPIYCFIGGYPLSFICTLLFISGLIIFRHRSNIVRLINGTEPKAGMKKKDNPCKCM